MSVKGPSFEVFTLFPELVQGVLAHGLLGKARQQEYIQVFTTNYRAFADNPRGTVDDTPYGGGPGMVMRVEPVVAALEQVTGERGAMHRILLTPSAPRFDQRMAERLAKLPRIGLLCGRYEGIDDRVREAFVDECISIGDFILNGGEIAALAIMEAVARLCEGVLGNPQSIVGESFVQHDSGAWLEAPQYTRPEQFRGHIVPAVLRSGDHRAIARWRAWQSWQRSWEIRPDLRLQTKSLPPPPIYLLPLFPQQQQTSSQLESDLQKLVSCFSQVQMLFPKHSEPQQILRKIRKNHPQPLHIIFVSLWVNRDQSSHVLPSIPLISHPKQLIDFLVITGENNSLGPVLWIVSYHASQVPPDWQRLIQAVFVPQPLSKRDLQLELAKRSPISESLSPRALAEPMVELVATALLQVLS